MKPQPTPLDELMLLVAFAPSELAGAAWSRLAPVLDLDTMPRDSHLLLPMLSRRVRQLEPGYRDLPRLDGVRRRAWYVNSRRLDALARALQGLEAAGCGPVVTGELGLLLVEADLGLRWLGDADVVVSGADPAAAVLEAAGWTPGPPRVDGALLDQHARSWFRPGGHALTLRWSRSSWPHDAAARALRLPAPGQEQASLAVAAPADLLAFALVDGPHIPTWSWLRLDAAALALLPRVDPAGWGRVRDVAAARGALRPVAARLRRLAARFGAAVPEAGLVPGPGGRRAADWLAARAAGRSDLLTAYLSRRSAGRAGGLGALLVEAWQLPGAASLPGAALRRARARLR